MESYSKLYKRAGNFTLKQNFEIKIDPNFCVEFSKDT